MANNFVMSDLGIMGYADKIEKELDAQEEVLNEYVRILKDVNNNAIKSGEVHDVIEQIIEYINSVISYDKGRGAAIKKEMTQFISRIDSIDLKIYGD